MEERSQRQAEASGLHTAFATKFATEFPERKDRTIWNALRAALLEQFTRLDRLATALPLPFQESEPLNLKPTFDWLEECGAAVAACNELFGWIRSDERLTMKQALELPWLRNEEMSDEATRLLRRIGRRARPGRPIKRRDLAILALEFKSGDQSATWAAVAARLCPCDQAAHSKTCAEAIRRDVIRLKAILRKYSITITI